MKQAVKVFKALSDPTRLRIIMLLLEREMCVCELVFTLKMEQSRISHQLRVLREAELVEDLRDGKWTSYRIPEKTKKNLRLIFTRVLGQDFINSSEFREGRKNLDICLKEEIRKRKIN